MSRNFELLYQVGRAGALLGSEPEPAVSVTSDAMPASAAAAEAVVPSPTIQIEGVAREEMSKLVHRLFVLPGADGPRHVVFAGMEPGDGCSWICARAGELLAAQVRGSVCIVDCDLRSPSLHEQFGTDNHYGLSDSLLGEGPIRRYARPLSRSNLWLVTCGASSAEAEPLLSTDRMRRRMSELRSEFRYMLMDAGALNTGNNAVVLGGLADGVVLVLKANTTRRDSTRETVQELQTSNVRVLGAVLNQRTFPIPERVYRRL